MRKQNGKAIRYTAALLVTAAACIAGGCGKKAVSVETVSRAENGSEQEVTIPETETDRKPESGSEADAQKEKSAALPLEITTEYDNDWQDNHSLLSTKTSQVHILDETHAALQKALDALNQKNLDSQKSFMADNQADARQMYQDEPEMMENNGWESELTLTAVRADETVLCLMQTDYSWLGGAHPNTYITGITYDTQTGKELSLKGIAKDYDGIYDYVLKKLAEENDPDMFFEGYEDTVKAMFYGGDANYGQVQWFLTNDGVTIWFNQYDIAPYAAGPVTVEIPFEKQGDLFEKQYETTKTSYVKELPEYGTVEADVNGDGKKEAISYEVARDEYGTGGAITVTCGAVSFSTASLIDQDYGASGGYSSEGYVIHTEDEKTYLYLQHQSDNDSHYINVFDLTTGTPYYVGFTGSSWSGSPITDPDSFLLWDRLDVLGTYSAYKEYHVGADGMPETDDTLFRLGAMSHENPITLVSTRDLEVTVLESGSEKQETMPAGTSFVITATDGESFVEANLSNGRTCRIPVTKDADGWEWKIHGVSEYDCFEQLYYAG